MVVRCYGIRRYDYRYFQPRPFFFLRMRKYKLKSYERLSLFEQVLFILRVLLCFLLWIPASISLHFPHVPLNEDRNLIFLTLHTVKKRKQIFRGESQALCRQNEIQSLHLHVQVANQKLEIIT